jgi:dUTP pyrophosphatase
MLALPTLTVSAVTVMVGVETTNMMVMMASRTKAAMMPVAALMGPNIRTPAPDNPTTTIQIHTDGHSFSEYRTSEDEGVFRAGTGEDWSGVGMDPAYRALAIGIASLLAWPAGPALAGRVPVEWTTVSNETAVFSTDAASAVTDSSETTAAYGAPTLEVQLKMLDAGLEAPSYAHPGDAGADLRAREDVHLAPGERKLVPTGVSIALPDGFVALIHPRSGLATKHGLTVVNAPGTVDAGYRGEIAVTLLNTDQNNAIDLKRGDRIAQMVIQRVEYAQFVAVDQLSDSVRGTGGFGSTGGFNAPKA